MKRTCIYQHILPAVICLITLAVQAQKKEKPLFTLLTEKQTGISYINNIIENDSLNVLKYEYLYNGAGVGVGDFNNDGLTDVFFSGNTTRNKLFLNSGNLRFTDITKQAGVEGNGTWATGVSVADVNGDGLLDVYVCHSGKYADSNQLQNELFIHQGMNNGLPVFKEMAGSYGLNAPGTQSTQAAFFDYDMDGDLDMFLLNHSNHSYNPLLNTRKVRSTPHRYFGNRLFRNELSAGNIIFKDVTAEAGIINHALNYGLSVTVSDVNGDGWPDLYTTSDYSENDCYYVNNHNGTFTESVKKSFMHISKYSMGADIADYNNDGHPDVFTLDMLPEDNYRQKLLKGPDEYDQYHLLLDSGYYHQQMRNMLHLNQGADQFGNTRFSEIGQLAGVSNTDWSWAGLFADFDNDGWKDLFVSNGYLRDFTNMDFLKYTVADARVAAAKQGHQNFQTYDLVKKMPSNKLSNYIFKNNRDLTFTNATRDWGLFTPTVSNASAYADLDNDGDLDLIICSNNEPVSVYRNNLNETNTTTSFIKLRLKGKGLNTRAFGAKVSLTTTDGLTQWLELNPVRGYQSTCTQDLLFGISTSQSVKQLKVVWPGGRETIMQDIQPGVLLEPDEAKANASANTVTAPAKRLFLDISGDAKIDFKHRENDFIDFKQEVLLPYQLSRQGPALAKADVNGDGLEDVFIGGAIGQAGVIYQQTPSGVFTEIKQQAFSDATESEDVNALFFDVDMDNDPDLYVVSGGNEYADDAPEYQDRLYINDSKGNFELAKGALPVMTSNKQAVAAADFDSDGDMDLFVGGRGMPGSFPLNSKSYILRNDTKDGTPLFVNITDQCCPELRTPGMVTIASWADLNHDKYPELLVGGDWMPLMLFENNKGKLKKLQLSGLQHTSGMWSAMLPADVDGDGDTDFILGNCGLNNQFRASEKEPMTINAADFDDNGSIEPVLSYYVQGKSYPMASRDEILDQVPALRKKFIKYADYASADINGIFSKEKLNAAMRLTCEELASGILYNKGNNEFTFTAFDLQAQFSRVNAIQWSDFDQDGTSDILLAGNFYPNRVQSGSSDASLGLFLKGKGKGVFEAAQPYYSNCYIDGDVRSMVLVKDASGRQIVIAGKNNGPVQVLKVNK